MKLRPTLTQQVVGYVLHQRGASQHPSLRAILVLTDETDAAYLSDLRAALQPHFDTVRLEADVPDVLREADDNYFNYQARPPHPHSYIPDFKRGIDHFCIHAGGRAVVWKCQTENHTIHAPCARPADHS